VTTEKNQHTSQLTARALPEDIGRRHGQAALVAELIGRTRQGAVPNNLAGALEALTATIVDLGVADRAGVTERVGRGGFQTLAPTDDVVSTVDSVQYQLDEGPCVQAGYHTDLLHSGDVTADQRWPRWGPAAARHGVHSVISVQLHVSDSAIGALNMYGSAPREYRGEDLELARIIGAHASIVLATHRSETHLWKAIGARHRIGQAQGILMERFKIDADKAFTVLRRLSQQHNMKLHMVADHLIVTGRLPETAQPDTDRREPDLAS